MKQFLIVLFTLTVFINVQGQSKAESQVANATKELTKAMVDGDRATLEKLAADQLNYGHSGGHIDDKKEFVEKIASGNSDFLSIDITEQTITISGKTAIVRHILTAKTHDKGKDLADVHLRVILVWQKLGGQWKLLARQAVKIT
ncbi:MAG TPA: nuclear transport factor 2 family protein [Chitinophagaceae bacterium]|nr:nuclear transport factor 2 family protein [Chitinophagaceae bacterium]